MEAIAALSLACNVLQIASSAHELVSLCYRLYDNRHPDPGSNVDVNHLHQMLERLKIEMDHNGVLAHPNLSQHPAGSAANMLQDLASDLTSEATKLRDTVAKIAPSASQSLTKSVQKSVRYMFKDKKRIESLQARIERLKSTLNSELLLKIWYVL